MKKRKYSLQTLLKRRESVVLQLEKERERLCAQINNLGWGAGMRRVHIIPSFVKEDRLRERLREIEEEIKNRIREEQNSAEGE